MLTDKKLEYSTQWQVKIGPDIGGPVPYVPPSSFTIVPATATDEYMHVSIVGSRYTDGMAALQRPLLPYFNPAAVPFSLEYEIYTDGNAPAVAQAIETTVRVSDPDGYLHTGGGQLNYQQGGQFQIYGSAEPWTNTPVIFGKYVPGVPYRMKWKHLLNTVAHTLSVLSIEVNGVLYPLPASIQNVPAQPLKWTPGMYLQCPQLDLASKGGAFSVALRKLKARWE